MSELPSPHLRSCPYLGLQDDRTSIFIQPREEHRCYATARPQSIDLEHQRNFCLTPGFEGCSRFVPLSAVSAMPSKRVTITRTIGINDLATGEDSGAKSPPRPLLRDRLSLLQLAAWALILLLVVGLVYGYLNLRQSLIGTNSTGVITRPVPPTLPVNPPTPTPAPTFTVIPMPTSSPVQVAAVTPVPSPAPVATLPPGELQTLLYPASNAVGWVASDAPLNHFGDRNLYVGFFDGKTYYGAMQFKLGSIPPGSVIEAATLEVMGLSSEQLGTGGTWALRLLGPEIDEGWVTKTYEQIRQAPVLDTIPPELTVKDLAIRQVNVFSFTPTQLAELNRRVETGLVSFRLDGPQEGTDNLFTWNTGYGEGFGSRPILRLIYQLPPTPTPLYVIAGTETPTPANVVTAAALAATATYEATTTGTPTPQPADAVIVTPTPPVVVTNTPVPGNTATAAWIETVVAAEVQLYGTPTPLPTDFLIATSTPTYVIITSVPTPENVLTVAAIAQAATFEATTVGTPTPLPPNWVTPVVVTMTPMPENTATALFQQAEATAIVKAFGSSTPTPPNLAVASPTPTATATPIMMVLQGELPPMTPMPVISKTMDFIPAQLIGKIAFKSDRTGVEQVYVINPDGSGLALLSNCWAYALAEQADAYSADGRFRVFTKDMIRYKNVGGNVDVGPVAVRDDAPAIYWYDALYKAEELVTKFGAGIAYGGVWSPTREQIAFVSNDSGNDELWVVNRDGSGLLQLTRDEYSWWDKHPSWSPDGNQIAFWSNRTGHGQIFVMNPDGSNLYSLSRTGFNDWDPVWIKYPGIPVGKSDYIGSLGSCSPDLNCDVFLSQAEAQGVFMSTGGPTADPYGLDADRNGIACENLLLK